MSHHLCYNLTMKMKNDKPTYTLWNGSQLLKTYPHTREGYTAALEQAADFGGYWLKIYSSRDDLVWSAKMAEEFEEPSEPSDAWHDADALASAGMGTDEDYGYYGD